MRDLCGFAADSYFISFIICAKIALQKSEISMENLIFPSLFAFVPFMKWDKRYLFATTYDGNRAI